MDVEKFFRPNKWFVFFCALLVLVWLVLQQVSSERIKQAAMAESSRIYSWHASRAGFSSRWRLQDVRILKRSNANAVVEVKGFQKMICEPAALSKAIGWSPEAFSARSKDKPGRPAADDTDMTLTFYKLSDNWVLGRVEQKQ